MEQPAHRSFYGRRIVAASFAILFVSVGTGLYAPPVFLVPLQEEFGWSRAQISTGGAIAALMCGILAPLVGGWIDRYGARIVLTAGGVMMGTAFALLSLMTSLWHMYAINLIAAAGITCAAWIPNQTLISNWFEQKRGLAMGLALAGIGFGGLVIAPFGSLLISQVGWRLAYAGMASLVFLIIVPLAVGVVRSRPADLGLLPDGEPIDPHRPDTAERHTQIDQAELLGLDLGEAFRTSAFWILCACSLFSVFAGSSIVQHVVAFLTDQGFDPQMAARLLGLTVGVSVAGRLGLGFLADRLAKRTVMILVLLLHALSVVFLFGIHSIGAVPGFVALFGIALGGGAVLTPLLVGEYFGLRAFGKILGATMIPATLGAALGPVVAGRIFDVTGSYELAFEIDLAAFMIGAVLLLFLRSPRRAERVAAPSPW
jgi:MFS family permease